ncbi:hypothetical protein [Megasphaera hominis]|uniref:Uncharacterized protein n=1 Tax=Megasphaera hominis TaxID=159836 RepID=A0ABR6VKV4_9FIRM|nr:hypothetical protein [Megasphaera hominis]MBC3537821.1 hypothetical protein [Megasphaera hominis]
MAEATDFLAMLKENLQDMGCSDAEVAVCLELAKRKNRTALRRQLLAHQRSLRKALHDQQAKLDCLDFLLYKIGGT